ncbi:hypothetical protein H0H92_014241 [Tricholoma furcatifolium]|nr:hypothetical protein H0H92_014241 [Tricholoma furcatifolium]
MDSISSASLASISAILTPTESNAFHSFLSSINPLEDWIQVDSNDDKHALTRATKDLLSLDTNYATHGDHLYAHILNPSQQHPPHSDSSSRTPTPTSQPPFLPPIRTTHRAARPHPHPYPPSPRHRVASPIIKPTQTQPKPPLLTASQKKANHIQSEQKRRANIRRGYEALCECVPALREAIREEEEALALANADHSNSHPNSNSNSNSNSSSSQPQAQTQKRRSKLALKPKPGEEKPDGRAGPRSENVVLSKTIDYINELQDERSALLARLHRARSALPPGHPALVPPISRIGGGEDDDADGVPPWEREWKGGSGGASGGEDEDSS